MTCATSWKTNREYIFKSLHPAHQEKALGLMSRNQRTFFSVSRIFYLKKQFKLIPQSHSMHPKFRYRGTCMQLSISLKLVLTKLISGITQST